MDLLKKMVGKFEIPEKHHDQIYSAKTFSKKEIAEIFEALKAKKMEYSFFLDLISMSVVDGVVMESEKRMLGQILKMTDIKPEEFHNLINFAQITFNLAEDEPIDPMYMPTISMVFSWARKKNIKLYKQTTLAKSDPIDEMLKTQLLY